MVMENLRGRILRGEFAAGAPLRQDAIAKELAVSRIPVREALMQLEAQGLVKFEAHRGAVVTMLDASAIEELFYLRALLEADTLFHAVDLMTEETFAQAQAILAQFDLALESGTQIEHWAELNHRFHATLYQAANRPQALELIAQINLSCDRYVRFELLFAKAAWTRPSGSTPDSLNCAAPGASTKQWYCSSNTSRRQASRSDRSWQAATINEHSHHHKLAITT